MAKLAETLLKGLQAQRMMAIGSGNKARLQYLDIEIEKLKEQIKVADLAENDLRLRNEMGISE